MNTARAAAAPPGPARQRQELGPEIISPEVHADGSITFRLYAPKAAEVLLAGNVLVYENGPTARTQAAMQRTSQGVWELTTAPVDPGAYTYWFVVDGMRVPDPRCPEPRAGTNLTQPLSVVVPATPPAVWEFNPPVPHGCVTLETFWSATLGAAAGCMIYTPPGYPTPRGSARGTGEYPLLLLLHGRGDDESGWVAKGRAAIVLDNLIAAGRIPPLVVAMPYGHTGAFDDPQRIAREEPYFLGEVLALVDARYLVSRARRQRAVAGLSMGGGQALRLGLGHPDLFAGLGAFSAALLRPGAMGRLMEAELPERAAGLDVLYLSWGRSEAPEFLEAIRRLVGLLDEARLAERGVRYVTSEKRGTHTWPVWTQSLADFLELWAGPLRQVDERSVQ